MEIVFFKTIAQVDPDEWDELAGGHVTASYAWLRLIEEASPVAGQCRCLLAKENSRLLAATYFWEQPQFGLGLSLDDLLFGRLTRMLGVLGVTVLPALIGCDIFGHRHTILFRDELAGDTRQRLLSGMLGFLEELAGKKRKTLCFRGIPSSNVEMSRTFSTRGYLCSPEWPLCFLDVQWDSFAEYLRALRKRHSQTEKNIHRELNQSRRAGIAFEQLPDPAAVHRHLHALADSHYQRLNRRPFPLRPEFFQLIKARLGDKATIHTAVRDGRIIGMQVRLQSHGQAILPILGIDGDYQRKNALYFNLGYNRAIQTAIEDRLRQVGFGTLVYDTKIRRGCHLYHTNMYIWTRNAFIGSLLKLLIPIRTLRMRWLFPSPSRGRAFPGNGNLKDMEDE